MPSRTVEVHSIRITRYDYPEFDLQIVCGGGTYIRTLGADLAAAAGSVAVMSHLTRTAVGPFAIERSVSVDALRDQPIEPLLSDPLLAVTALQHMIIDEEQSRRLGHGLCLEIDPPSEDPDAAEAAAVDNAGRLRAIVRKKQARWCPHRVFPVANA
jgi:tRNA pseudouridine55 synthase